MADKLPNELIKEIPEPILDTPDDLFHDVSDIPPFARFNHESSLPIDFQLQPIRLLVQGVGRLEFV